MRNRSAVDQDQDGEMFSMVQWVHVRNVWARGRIFDAAGEPFGAEPHMVQYGQEPALNFGPHAHSNLSFIFILFFFCLSALYLECNDGMDNIYQLFRFFR